MHYLIPFRPQDVTLYYAENTIYNGNHGYSICRVKLPFCFILVLFYSTGFAFQIPIIQVILGLLNIVSAKQMIGAWRYVILGSTIIGAILTPSTDPLTQLLLSGAILALYFSGASILLLIKN